MRSQAWSGWFKMVLGGFVVLLATGCSGGGGGVSGSSGGQASSVQASSIAINPATRDEPVVRFIPPGSSATRRETSGGGERAPYLPQAMMTMTVNGVPVFLRGAGGPSTDRAFGGFTPFTTPYCYSTDKVAAGVNAMRTYGAGYQYDPYPTNVSNLANDGIAALQFAKTRSTPSGQMYVLVGFQMASHDANGKGAGTLDPSEPITMPYKYGAVNYNDPTQVAAQERLILETAAQIVACNDQDYQIGWCVGNEMDNHAPRAIVWASIDRIAAAMKTSSPGAGLPLVATSLPIMTAHNTISSAQDLQQIETALPHLDWLGINTYNGRFDDSEPADSGGYLSSLSGVFQSAIDGGQWPRAKPYVVTEFASYDLGGLNIPTQTLSGRSYCLEANSTWNARNYSNSFNQYVAGASARQANCVGGFCLDWMPPIYSNLMAHYFKMYVFRELPAYGTQGNADRLESVDEMTRTYGGTLPSQPCPRIVTPADGDNQGIDCSFKATASSAGTPVTGGDAQHPLQATLVVTDNVPVTVEWWLVGGVPGNLDAPNTGVQNYFSPGYFRINGPSAVQGGSSAETVSGNTTTSVVSLVAPTRSGNVYQLRAIVRDNKGSGSTTSGGAATAAIAFTVK